MMEADYSKLAAIENDFDKIAEWRKTDSFKYLQKMAEYHNKRLALEGKLLKLSIDKKLSVDMDGNIVLMTKYDL